MKLIKLHIENFFSFGVATIDFTTKASPVLIKGITGDQSQSNGSGKSSTLEGFFWCLTGKTVRGVRAGDVIRLGEKSCMVQAELEFNSQILKITRIYSASKKTVEIQFNGKNESFHDSRQGTERIFEILGIRDETLALACFYGSGFITFSGLGPQARSDMIDLLAQGAQWECARVSASNQVKVLGNSAAHAHEQWQFAITAVETNRQYLVGKEEAYDKKKSELSDQIESASSKIEKCEKFIADIVKQLEAIEPKDPAIFESAITELTVLKSTATKAKEEANAETITEGKANQTQIKELQEKLDAAKAVGNTAYRTRSTTEMRIESITKEVKSLQTEVETNACGSCGQALPSTDDGQERSTRIQERTQTLGRLENDLVRSDADRDSSSLEVVGYEKDIAELTAKTDELRSKLTEDNAKIDESIMVIDNEIASIRKQAQEDAQKSLDLTKTQTSMVESLSTAKQELTRLESNEDLVRLEEQVTQLRERRATDEKNVATTLQERKDCEERLAVKKFWAVAFKDIRFAAFENTVAALESLLNSYAEQQGLDFDRIEVSSRKTLSTGKEKPQIEIYLHRGSEKLSLDALSEGETQRVNIACFLAVGALIEKHVGYPLQLKIFDEPLGGVDGDGKGKIFQILSDLSDSGRQVLVIDHDAHFQDVCPTVITVFKEFGISRII